MHNFHEEATAPKAQGNHTPAKADAVSKAQGEAAVPMTAEFNAATAPIAAAFERIISAEESISCHPARLDDELYDIISSRPSVHWPMPDPNFATNKLRSESCFSLEAHETQAVRLLLSIKIH